MGIGPQSEHERSHIGCASAHGRARAIERPHIALDKRHAPVAPDEDDLRQARGVIGRRRARLVVRVVVDRRNEYRVFGLRADSRRRGVRRVRTREKKTKTMGKFEPGSILFVLLCTAKKKQNRAVNDGFAWMERARMNAWFT
jgi:hypothetical protein